MGANTAGQLLPQQRANLCGHAPSLGRIVSGFGPRRRPSGMRQHNGLDITGAVGDAIYAAADGRVTHADNRNGVRGFGGYGRIIVIHHPAERVWTLYAHLNRVLVEVPMEPGAEVRAGQLIGRMGKSSGRLSAPDTVFRQSAAHLHFEVSPRAYPQRYSQSRIDPRAWLAERGVRYDRRGRLLEPIGCRPPYSPVAPSPPPPSQGVVRLEGAPTSGGAEREPPPSSSPAPSGSPAPVRRSMAPIAVAALLGFGLLLMRSSR